MKKSFSLPLILFFLFFQFSSAQKFNEDSAYVRDHYTKIERQIPMRDGVKLFTSIYIPKDTSQKYPILLNRTPYTVSPYGENEYKKSLGNFPAMMREGFIFVYQDVRGKWMSEGEFVDVRPQLKENKSKGIDESTDTYDTLEWLLKNLDTHNGKSGVYGISYPGFYSTASLVNAHPSLKAVSPQAPVTNWFIGDDFHHNGVFFVYDAFSFMSGFGRPRPEPITPDKGPKRFSYPVKDAYRFFLESGSAKNLKDKYFGDTIAFWNELFKHPDYDDYWKDKNILPHLKNVKPAVMVVGGFFDAENTYGAFETYKAIENQNKTNENYLVAGPWFHGGWVRGDGSTFGDIQFDSKTSITYQEKFELPFFNYYLKGKGSLDFAEANVFISGSNEWLSFETWPPKNVEKKKIYLQANGKISFEKPTVNNSFTEYVSDPNNPVPHQGGVITRRTREYMIDDQRFAFSRPDVMVFQTDPLEEDITITGPVLSHLVVSTSGTDADYVVKLIDVYPEGMEDYNGKIMSGYQMLVRTEIMRGRYRYSFEKPIAIKPSEITKVEYTLPDIGHTFKKGHRIMIQIQNTWFPLADRNPQKYMNVYEADVSDFQKATHRIYHDSQNSTYLEVDVLKP